MTVKSKKPNFFIVGAPRTGTTAMWEYLRRHPDIFMPTVKEPHFFGSDLQLTVPRCTEKQYIQYFKLATTQKRLGEASTLYLYSKKAPYEIKNYCSDALIIAMLRNPVDMMYSLHGEGLYVGREDIKDFETALQVEPERHKGRKIPKVPKFIDALFYRAIADYTNQIDRYFKVFGRENVMVIIFDDFKKNVAAVYQDILGFLGVAKTYTPDFKIINASKKVRIKYIRNFIRRASGIPLLRSSVHLLTPALVRRKALKMIGRYNTYYTPRASMEEELRRKLQAEFSGKVEQLSKLLGRDLTYWCK